MSTPSFTGQIITEGEIKGQYCYVDDVREYLSGFGVDCKINETNVNNLVRFAKSFIDNETQKDFSYHSDAVEFHNGNGKNMIQTLHFPIKKITHVIMYNQVLQAMRTFLDQELIIYPQRGQIALPPIYPVYITDTPFEALFGNVFIPGIYNIEVQYDYGYEIVPEDIKQCACIHVSKKILLGHIASLSGGLGSVQVPGYSENYGSSPYFNIIKMMDEDFKILLSKNKRIYARSI